MSPTAVIQLGFQVTVINNKLVRNLISKSLDNNGQYNVQRHPKMGITLYSFTLSYSPFPTLPISFQEFQLFYKFVPASLKTDILFLSLLSSSNTANLSSCPGASILRV